MTTMTHEERIVNLTRAIRDHSGLELGSIREAGEHGADAGWAGFTYTLDGAEFYRANADLIDEMLQEAADAFGHDNVAQLVATFTRADMTDTRDGHDCLLAWYALEECGRFWNDREAHRRNDLPRSRPEILLERELEEGEGVWKA